MSTVYQESPDVSRDVTNTNPQFSFAALGRETIEAHEYNVILGQNQQHVAI